MWVVKIYQTHDMEAAMRRMYETNRNSVVYWRHRSNKPIRMRLNMVRDIPVEQCHAWKPFAQATIERWQTRGGVMVWRPHPLTHKAPVPACDAMLFVECPLQIDRFNASIANVKQEVIVYRPPTWKVHNDTVDHFYPGKDTYITLEAIAKALVGRELTEEMQGVLDACGYPASSTAVFTGWDIEQLTGWSEAYLKYALHYKYRYHSGRWCVYSVRIPPDDADMRWAYDILRQQPEVSRKTHAMRLGIPAGPFIPGFKTMMRQLLRSNYVVREDNIYVINTAHPPLDHDRVDAINNMHRGRWFAMKALVDGAEEYPI